MNRLRQYDTPLGYLVGYVQGYLLLGTVSGPKWESKHVQPHFKCMTFSGVSSGRWAVGPNSLNIKLLSSLVSKIALKSKNLRNQNWPLFWAAFNSLIFMSIGFPHNPLILIWLVQHQRENWGQQQMGQKPSTLQKRSSNSIQQALLN